MYEWINPEQGETATEVEVVSPPLRDTGAIAIRNVVPLCNQIGADAPLTVPEALFDAVFGQNIQGAVDSAGHEPILTYALLDAARIINLVELLENSGLEYRCLFNGEAADTLRDVAPWLVRLEQGNSFTRNLFTRSAAGWHLWDAQAGVFVRARKDIDTLRRCLRKFTMVQTEKGAWLYFRFWEPRCLWHLLSQGDPLTQAQLLGCGSILTHDPAQGRVTMFPQRAAPVGPQVPFALRKADMLALRAASTERYLSRMDTWLGDVYGAPRGFDDVSRRDLLRGLSRRAWALGLTSERVIADFVAASWLMGQPVDLAFDLGRTEPKRLPSRLAQLHKQAADQDQRAQDARKLAGAG